MNAPPKVSWPEPVSTIEKARLSPPERAIPWRLNLYRLPWLHPLLESRWPQFLVRAVCLAGFIFAIAAGLFGSIVGSHNFAIIFVWIAWWSAFKLAFIPFGGRSWCSICPIPLPGEWLQQGGILTKGRGLGLSLRWPKRLKGSWIQSGLFLLIGLFSALTLTDPRLAGWLFAALFVLAIGMSLVFEQRAFCNSICPIGGFSGIYAQTAPLELRVIDTEICARHDEKTCYQACPWGLYPVAFRDNAACGLCMECLRACPRDNLALSLRPFGSDIGKQRTANRLDEAFLALVMLGSALAFAAVFLGPWGWLKSAAFAVGSLRWVGYAAGFLALNLLLLPGLFTLSVWAGGRYQEKKLALRGILKVGHMAVETATNAGIKPPGYEAPPSWGSVRRRADFVRGRSEFIRQKPDFKNPLLALKREIANQSQALLPLGLMAWMAFTVSFALPKLGYILAVVNDPFGWGWSLLGARNITWSPDVSAFSPLLQVVLLVVGLFWSADVSRKLAGADFRRSLPIQAFCLAFSLSMLWLLIG